MNLKFTNMKNIILTSLLTLLLLNGSYCQLKVWSNGSVSAGTVTTINDPTNPSGHTNKMFVDGGTSRGLYIRTQHDVDWFQSITSCVSRKLTVSYVVNYNAQDNFFVRGDGFVYAHGVWIGSDIKFKTNVQPIENALDKILKIQGVTYQLKEQTPVSEGIVCTLDSCTYMGFIAQELEKIVPEVVKDMNGTKAVSYQNLTSLLVEGVKEQQSQIDDLKKEVDRLQKELNISSNGSAKLYQNRPNPFKDATTIEYELISDNISDASIYVYDLNGTQKLVYELPKSQGKSQIQLSARALQAGMYLYTLLVNGEVIDTKRMIITE